MAKGITEAQVHAAADALVIGGERPTVERIRAHLGTGSPNTVTRLLETWWQTLGTRLAAIQATAHFPAVPVDLAALAEQWWTAACHRALQQMRAELATDRDDLAAARASLETERQTWTQDLAQHAQAATDALQQRTLAETRLADAQRLIEQQATQVADLTHQRSELAARHTRLEAECSRLTDHAQALEAAAIAERENHAQHLRAAEDHGHAEVDRARQEAKTLKTRLATLERQHAMERERHHADQQAWQVTLVEAKQALATWQARAQTLERQWGKLGDLPTLLRKQISPAGSPRSPAKRARSSAPDRKKR